MRVLLRRIGASVLVSLVMVLSALASAQATPKLLLDMNTGEVLYAEDAGLPWHPASLTKLMTVLVTLEAIESGRVSLDTPVITSANALSVPPSKMGFPVDTAVSLRDALYILVTKSANDIAVAVAETIGGTEDTFVAMMNQRARQMGLTGTHFVNPHGLHDPRQVITARDIAVVALTIRSRFPGYDPLFTTQAVSHGGTVMDTHNNLLEEFAGTDGMKTGFVCASGLNIVATAMRDGRHLMAVVLGGASARERGEMAAQMLYSGFAGGYRGLGYSVTQLSNQVGVEPVNMRPEICGSDAAAYAAARKAAFPAGLDGEVSYLNADIDHPVHAITTLGRIRDVALPRPRPDWAPVRVAGEPAPAAAIAMGDAGSAATPAVPLPRPRPAGL